jgi:hypothetical protein
MGNSRKNMKVGVRWRLGSNLKLGIEGVNLFGVSPAVGDAADVLHETKQRMFMA